MDSFTVKLVSNASGDLFRNNTLSSFTNFFTRASEIEGAMGGCNFRNILPINVPNINGGEIQVF